MQTRNLSKTHLLTILLFIIIFLLGSKIYLDYGISLDEEFHRENANFWYKYIKFFFLNPNISFSESLKNLLSQHSNNELKIISMASTPSLQPLPLAIICEFFIDIFNIEGSKDIYQFRHLFNFIIYFIGLYFFYQLIQKRYKSNLFSLVGVLILFLTPRFFAESFYNQQDIFFLALTIINMFIGINFLEKPNLKNSLFFSISAALSIDTRIMGIIPVFIILLLFCIKLLRSNLFLKSNLKFIFFIIPVTLFFILLFWPYLWSNPFENFIFALSEMTLDAPVTNFYLGKFILSTNIPWHYHIIWIVVTTPLVVTLLFSLGFIFMLKRTITRITQLNENLNDIWRGENEMMDIYFLMMIFLPLIIFINKGLGYSGWRHLYFIYPSILMISLYGLYYLHFILKFKIFRNSIYALIIINLIYLVYWNYSFHPYQYVYFNPLFKKDFNEKFEMDYWGLSNKSALDYIVKNNVDFPVKVATKSFASLEKSSLIFNESDKAKISIIHDLDDADYIITNYITRIRKNYIIDKSKYEKFYEVLVDNKAINTVYKKIN